MTSEWIAAVIARELVTLKRELSAYPEEGQLWTVVPGMSNSAGTLALHLAGNLRHFIGAVLGKTGYVRNRDAEFASRNVPRVELLAQIDDAIAVVTATMADLGDVDLTAPYPGGAPSGHQVATGDFLIHLESHLAYHLGQVDYHRRVITGQAKGVAAVAIPELKSARLPPS